MERDSAVPHLTSSLTLDTNVVVETTDVSAEILENPQHKAQQYDQEFTMKDKDYEVRCEDSPKDYLAFAFWLGKTSEKPNQVIKSKGLMPRTHHRPSGFSPTAGENLGRNHSMNQSGIQPKPERSSGSAAQRVCQLSYIDGSTKSIQYIANQIIKFTNANDHSSVELYVSQTPAPKPLQPSDNVRRKSRQSTERNELPDSQLDMLIVAGIPAPEALQLSNENLWRKSRLSSDRNESSGTKSSEVYVSLQRIAVSECAVADEHMLDCGQPIRGGPPAWGLGEGLTTHHRKKQLVTKPNTKYRIDFVEVQEVRSDGNGISQIEDYLLYYGEGDNNHQLGTGFFVHKRIKSAVKKVEFISDRLSYLVLKGRWCEIVVINAHAPTEEKDNIKDSFYEELEQSFDQLSRYTMKILLGDFNAKVGREDIFKPTIGKESLHVTSNDNGVRSASTKGQIPEWFGKNRGYKKMCKVAQVLEGVPVGEIDGVCVCDIPLFKYARLTSCDVERSFSQYKSLFRDNRHAFVMENLEMTFVVHCNSRPTTSTQ
ncbi:hypothetical protein ANN_22825 [Periplaneta americana]|uniref:Endonuclease/exonuclease/phosphatase domain-containing protein n=1 Tax=Periplaneta americana TaxID=6978 RepID=A0ABQ8SJU6_PERAM|nr:hypothetical protein ANN_22825 [Periplaneta americana]